MTRSPEQLHRVGLEAPPELVLPTLERRDRALDEAPTWPTTRLISWMLMSILGLSILGPAAAGARDGIERLSVLLPGIIATLGARALFDVLGFATGSRGLLRHLVSAVLPAMFAAMLMAGASVLLGVHWSPAEGGATVVIAMLTLSSAGAARGVEIRFRLAMRRVFFIGSPDARHDLERELARRGEATLVGASPVAGPSATSDRTRLVETVLSAHATALVLDGDAMRVPELVDAASQLNLAGLRVRDLVSYYEAEFKKVPLSELSPTWFLFDIASIHRRGLYRRSRRAIEVVVAAALLVPAAPLLLLAVAAIKLTSPGPALYRQRRVGKGGVEFVLLKLRTMTEDSRADPLGSWASSQSHRLTPVGRMLRRFRLDELPQLWNVMRGDLALIGPRPEQVPIVARLDRELPHYSSRHCIRPGITGWAQVALGYGGTLEGTVAKLQRDLYYVKHQSLRLDALIVWLTVRTVLAGRG